jgi:hypothetical protein
MDPLTEESSVWELEDDTIALLAEKYGLDPEDIINLIEDLGL